MNTSVGCKRIVERRAEVLASARAFFAQRNILEVDCPALTQNASVDVNIDLFTVVSPLHGTRYLFSSPEYAMKRLLSQGSGDIYYLGHVWRHEEAGRKHAPEFLMAEWYRIGLSFQEMIEETLSFIETIIPKRHHTLLSYQEAFQRYLNLDPFHTTREELLSACSDIEGYPLLESSTDDLLTLLLAIKIEPHFDEAALTVLYHYPPTQAALARHTVSQGHAVAERFEIYAGGLELANGYHELADPVEQRKRLIEENETRKAKGKAPYPIDEPFLQALESNFPDCCGVAVGIDRLIMLAEKASSIADIMLLPWTLNLSMHLQAGHLSFVSRGYNELSEYPTSSAIRPSTTSLKSLE